MLGVAAWIPQWMVQVEVALNDDGFIVFEFGAALEVLAESVDYAFGLLVVDVDEESGFCVISGDAYCGYVAVWDG